MINVVELSNIEKGEYCQLNLLNGERHYSTRKISKSFTGLYFEDDCVLSNLQTI